MNYILQSVFCFLLLVPFIAHSQTLLEMLDSGQEQNETLYVEGTFKASRLINGQTTEITAKNELDLFISHRFDEIKSGAYDFFGIDHSTMRIGLEYGLLKQLSIGYGRGNFQKLYDGYLKCQIFKQRAGAKPFPLTITLYSSVAVSAQKWDFPERNNLFSSRLYYVHQLMASRKFNRKFSAQFVSGFVHRNLVKQKNDQNNVPYIATGGRFLLTNRLALTAEYYFLLPGETQKKFNNSLSFGVDIDTGGHIFQLHVSNSRGMTEKSFIAETPASWAKGGVHFGFNIIRNFSF